MKESDLFAPIMNLFAADGYTGDGEVGRVDILFEKDGLTTAVELKKTLDFRSIQQAAIDQKSCDFVYIGIFTPKNMRSRSFNDRLYLLKRLGIGLICVSEKSGRAEIVSNPIVSELSGFKAHNRKKQASLKVELSQRRMKNNTGGVSKTPLMTAYKENALLILDCLRQMGGSGSCADIRKLSGLDNVTPVLYNNYYGWFCKVKKGVYSISESGRQALAEYADTIEKMAEHKQINT